MEEPSNISAELESFREQWRAEVKAKKPAPRGQPAPRAGGSAGAAATASSSSSSRPQRPAAAQPPRQPAPRPVGPGLTRRSMYPETDDDYVQARPFDGPPGEGTSASSQGQDTAGSSKGKEPLSALDHYEQAVEKESQGSLGESLRLYRKAFRMDSAVDKKYKNKHFPAPLAVARQPAAPAPAQPNPSNAAPTVPNTAHHSLDGSHYQQQQQQPQPPPAPPARVQDLIASFAGLAIEPAAPEMEGMPRPPCPIADLPDEILVHVLRDVAVADVADFVRLAQVCKRLAYLVATEEQIWRRVCVGAEFGFGGMHYEFQRGVTWEPLEEGGGAVGAPGAVEEGPGELLPVGEEDEEQRARRQQAESLATTRALLGAVYGSSWRRMFRQRPRVRFNGCYISTVNYIRSGQASANQSTWNSPVHIVTYFRYLRLFRDGTAISLLTTTEPAEVVHHLTRDLLALHRGGAAPHLPSAVMQNALRGRWRLSSAERPVVSAAVAAATATVTATASTNNPNNNPTSTPTPPSAAEAEGDLLVETEGVGKYLYRLELSLRSAGGGGKSGGGGAAAARNNKLVWRGFYSYNRLTDDWGEFALKNDKPFFFSRVKSYGLGE